MIENNLSELRDKGYCVLKNQFRPSLINDCRQAFWPVMTQYLENYGQQPNRGVHRHFLPMPFSPPCFSPELFFNEAIMSIITGILGDRIAVDQWGCDVPLLGSGFQDWHVDYQQPLFSEEPDLLLPVYFLVVSFGLVAIGRENGPIEIAQGTHRMIRKDATRAVAEGRVKLEPVELRLGDVLVRHPWALHRGTPNLTDSPRPLASIRYVRRWYCDDSREVDAISKSVWMTLTAGQRALMRFPLSEE